MMNDIIDMTKNNLNEFMCNSKENKMKFIWEFENLEVIGRYIESIESNYSEEIGEFKLLKNKNEICYDSFWYEVIDNKNNKKNDKIFELDGILTIEISIYDYPDKILNLNGDIIWDSSRLEVKYKKIIDTIRCYKIKFNQNQKFSK